MRRLVLVLLLAAAAAGASAAHAAAVRFGPTVQRDPSDTPGSPLDLREVTFGQQDAQILLHVRTAAPWNAAELGDDAAHSLCIAIHVGVSGAVTTRICVAGRDGLPVLRLEHVDAAGRTVDAGDLPALIGRPDRRTLDASISRLAAGLPLGAFSWTAESRWDDPTAPCADAGGCADTVPDAGAVPDRLQVLAEPACFGAAARDPRQPCRNPALHAAVIPTPDDALITPNAYCKLTQRIDLVSICEFGVPAPRASTTIVAVGDSHTEHWRGALEVLAQARGWHGISITRASCPLTRAQPISPRTAAARRQCLRWNDEVLGWFRRHPEIHTVFVSDHATVHLRGDAPAGYQAAWRQLPSTVSRIVVLRDTPQVTRQQAGCVRRRIAARRPAAVACAEERGRDVVTDPQAVAAEQLRSRRVQVVDLTDFFCGARLCFPVVGGALVHKDTNHITRTFATTLGPYLLRAYGALPPR